MGGGSGGHVTPVVAVLDELKKRNPSHAMRFWCDRAFATQAQQILRQFDATLPVETITAGKLRRYTHLSLWQHVREPSVFFPNLFDMLKVATGFVQACVKLIVWRPDIIFLKGGYVCLPVGWAARLLRIPYVIHDSDAHPGLTNRLLAPHARHIATGAPLEYYSYPAHKSSYVGIPISRQFTTQLPEARARNKQALGFGANFPLTVVTGGGLGAKRINDAVVNQIKEITTVSSLLIISGSAQYEQLRAAVGEDTDRCKLVAFVSSGMAECIGAADVVVARAGATTLLELAAVSAPTILVPNARLSGGHQVKNAKVYSDAGAVIVADEEEFEKAPQVLSGLIQALLRDNDKRDALRQAIHLFSRPHAAREVADIIENVASNSRSNA